MRRLSSGVVVADVSKDAAHAHAHRMNAAAQTHALIATTCLQQQAMKKMTLNHMS